MEKKKILIVNGGGYAGLSLTSGFDIVNDCKETPMPPTGVKFIKPLEKDPSIKRGEEPLLPISFIY